MPEYDSRKDQCEHTFFQVLTREFKRSTRARVQGPDLYTGALDSTRYVSLNATLFDAATQAQVLWNQL